MEISYTKEEDLRSFGSNYFTVQNLSVIPIDLPVGFTSLWVDANGFFNVKNTNNGNVTMLSTSSTIDAGTF